MKWNSIAHLVVCAVFGAPAAYALAGTVTSVDLTPADHVATIAVGAGAGVRPTEISIDIPTLPAGTSTLVVDVDADLPAGAPALVDGSFVFDVNLFGPDGQSIHQFASPVTFTFTLSGPGDNLGVAFADVLAGAWPGEVSQPKQVGDKWIVTSSTDHFSAFYFGPIPARIVPVPGAAALGLVGLAGLALRARKRA